MGSLRAAAANQLILLTSLFGVAWLDTPLTGQDFGPEVATSETGELSEEVLGDLDALLDADLGQLAKADVVVPVFSEEVTTVSRQESTIGRSPAAVYVLTGEMIRRSGVRSIPEALRLAPGVQVARIDANKWAVSIRGFNQRFANKLLVQIDGRTVYTPLFAGVFWDVQDVLLEDVARIEIIRGPGASVWGANAVNGVINIITKPASESRGVFADGGAGDERRFGSARVGGQAGNTSWRAYGKWFRAGHRTLARRQRRRRLADGQVRFRMDWRASCCDTVTLQGDYYDGVAGAFNFVPAPGPPFVTTAPADEQLSGGNVLVRWSHEIDDRSDWSLQVYYDRTEREMDAINFREDRDTVDFDFQHRFGCGDWHSIIWGFGISQHSRPDRNATFNLQFFRSSVRITRSACLRKTR